MARSTKGLYKHGPVWWMTYRDALGTQRFESCKTANKAEAEKQLIDRRKEASEGIRPAPVLKPVGLEELFEEYLKHMSHQRGLRTKQLHVQHFRRIWENPPLHTLTVKVVEEYRETRRTAGVGPATINKELATLKHALTKAVAWKMVQKHIREDLKAVQKEQEPPGRLRYLADHQEAERLIQTCGDHFSRWSLPHFIRACAVGRFFL